MTIYNEIMENYNIISKSYDNAYYTANNIESRKIYKELNKVISENTFKSAIEFGCGTGYWLECLNMMGFEKIIGTDFSDGMICKARKRCMYYNNTKIVKLMLPDEFEPDEKFDLILSMFFISSLMHNEKVYALLNKIKMCLTDGGRVIIVENKIPDDKLQIGIGNMILEINEKWNKCDLKCKYNLFSDEVFSKMIDDCSLKIISRVDISEDIYYIIIGHRQ